MFFTAKNGLVVGLRVLLSPFGSNIVTRAACCSIGVGLPVYSTFKAIEKKDQAEQQKWLLYWAAHGSFSLVEAFADKILSWFPLYYHAKFAFLVWLQLPTVEGSRLLYNNYLRPFFLRHQARLDNLTGLIYSEIVKFAVAHQGDIQFAKKLFWKMWSSVGGIIHPAGRPSSGRIGGPSTQKPDMESESEDGD
uniref:HVA22-like protein n=1 Tax=Kalanchoe fedtschenkoi TaxID=63787 RepID=A0A7N0T0F5_KALFE